MINHILLCDSTGHGLYLCHIFCKKLCLRDMLGSVKWPPGFLRYFGVCLQMFNPAPFRVEISILVGQKVDKTMCVPIAFPLVRCLTTTLGAYS